MVGYRFLIALLTVGSSSSRGFLCLASAIQLERTTTPPLLDVPTYSLASLGKDGKTNMNILTYATPVSVRPERVWSIGLYKETLSHANFKQEGHGILQLLCQPHSRLVPLLGGISGKDADKQKECERLGFPLQSLTADSNLDLSLPLILPGCAHYLILSLVEKMYDAGSHDVAICKVESMWTSALTDKSSAASASTIDDLDYLSTGKLREMGIITEQGRVAESFLQ